MPLHVMGCGGMMIAIVLISMEDISMELNHHLRMKSTGAHSVDVYSSNEIHRFEKFTVNQLLMIRESNKIVPTYKVRHFHQLFSWYS